MKLQTRTDIPIRTADYLARIRSFELIDGQFGPQVKWEMALGDVENVEGGTEHDKTLSLYTQDTASPRNKLGKLAIAAGYDFGSGVDLETEDIVGREVTISVTVVTRDDNTLTNKIIEVRRPTGRPGQTSSANGRPVTGGDNADLPF
ncbi:MAG: hypothetical protein IPG72_16140 [Ardenticatenales bacterium]|nr:hypothetical protein [Ardenticatenales bacterium]